MSQSGQNYYGWPPFVAAWPVGVVVPTNQPYLAGATLLDMPPNGGIFGPKLTSGQVLLQRIGSIQILYKLVDGFSLWSGR